MLKSSILFVLVGITAAAYAQSGLRSDWVAFNRAGAPNSNLQCFSPNNVKIIDGNLAILSKAEVMTCSSIDLPSASYKYTSGFVSMRSFRFLYGSVQVRAKFGGGMRSGAWPCIWMLDASCQESDPGGTDSKCNGQEIDIAEIMYGDFDRVNQQIHINSFAHNDQCTPSVSDASKNFHVYQLDWSAGQLIYRIDGKRTCMISKKYVPDAPMYLKIDTYVGGFGGAINAKSLPWTTLIDYVKVTQDAKVVFQDGFDGKRAD